MTPPAPSLELLIPGLFGPAAPAPRPTSSAVRALEAALARADRSQHGSPPEGDDGSPPRDGAEVARRYHAALWRRFFPDFQDDAALPLSPYLRAADVGAPDPRYSLSVSPVHLRPQQDRLILFPADELEVTEAEGQALSAAFNHHFADQGLELLVPATCRWYLCDPPRRKVETVPLHQVAGRNIQHALPRGEDAGFWNGILNETQMLFHLSEVNQQRELRGEPPINGIWLHDGGAPLPLSSHYTSLHGDAQLLRGLALSAGVAVEPLEGPPPGLEGRRLAATERLLAPLLREDGEAWAGEVERLAEQLLPLLRRARRSAGGLRINPCDGQLFDIRPGDPLRFWRRPAPLGTLSRLHRE